MSKKIDNAQLPNDWEIKKLGEVLVKTETFDPTKKPNDEFIYLDVSSVNKETKEIENATVLLGKNAPSRARKLIRTNDVIFATVRPTHGRVAVITEEYDEQVCSTGYFVLRGKEFMFNKYLYYFILTNDFNNQMEVLQKGASYPAVTDAEVKSIPIPVPPLAEQQRIVAYLDQTFAKLNQAKANTLQNLQNAKELFETELRNVFENKGEGWEEKTLGELAEYDKTPNKRNDLLYIGLEDIESNTGKFIGPENQKSVKSATFYFNENHILYGRLRPYLNKVLLPNFEGHCSTEIFPIKPKSNLVKREYLFWWLISNKTMNKINETWTGAVLPRANMNTVLNFKLLVPNLKTQQEIVSKLDALKTQTQQLESVYQTKLNNIEELYSGILKRAFENQLTIKA